MTNNEISDTFSNTEYFWYWYFKKEYKVESTRIESKDILLFIFTATKKMHIV